MRPISKEILDYMEDTIRAKIKAEGDYPKIQAIKFQAFKDATNLLLKLLDPAFDALEYTRNHGSDPHKIVEYSVEKIRSAIKR